MIPSCCTPPCAASWPRRRRLAADRRRRLLPRPYGRAGHRGARRRTRSRTCATRPTSASPTTTALPGPGRPTSGWCSWAATTCCCRATSRPSAAASSGGPPSTSCSRRPGRGRDGRVVRPAGRPDEAAGLPPARRRAARCSTARTWRSRLLRGNWLYWPSLAFRIEVLRRHTFLDDFPLVQDLALVIDMTIAGSRLLVLPDVVFAYRRHAASASSATLVDGGRLRAGAGLLRDRGGDRCAQRGWRRAARAARRHLASRLYAVTLLPRAALGRSWGSVRDAGSSRRRHVIRPGPAGTPPSSRPRPAPS